MNKLTRAYLYAIPLIVIGLIIIGVWFTNLLLWFGIAALVSLINYYLLSRVQKYEKLTQQNVLLTLLIRYLIFGAACFTMIWLNRNEPDLIGIAVVIAIGISIMKFATILNTLIHRKEEEAI